MNTDMYVQCELGYGNLTTTAWIPKIFAKIGKCIEIKADNAIWFVKKTYTEADLEYLKFKMKANRHQRESSDI